MNPPAALPAAPQPQPQPAPPPPPPAHDAFRLPRPAKPEPFDATSRTDVELWLFLLEEYFTATGVQEDQSRIHFAAALLRGPALTWWRAVKRGDHPPDSWEVFGDRMCHAFKPINSIKIARDRLALLRQERSVQTYTATFRNISLEIPDITEAELLDRYVRGLKPHIRVEVEVREPTHLDDAIRMAERFDAVTYQLRNNQLGRGNFRTYRNVSVPAPYQHPQQQHSQHGPTPMEIGYIGSQPARRQPPAGSMTGSNQRLTPELKKQLTQEGRCFYCREKGHMAMQCPKKKMATPSNYNRH